MLGPFLFAQPLVVWLLPAVAAAVGVLLRRTSAGLALRAAGEEPTAARARGVRVGLVRTAATVGGGALAGLGGAVLTAGLVGEFSDEVVGGRGWLALALVIVAGWRPFLLVPAALLVGSLQAFYLRAQSATDLGLPVSLLQALPFVVTLAVLSARSSSARAPAVLGRLTVEEA
jgi:simple sugar transport system permease protein